MVSEKRISALQASHLTQEMVGEFVWGVRCGADRVLQLEIGKPYLQVREIAARQQPDESQSPTSKGGRVVRPRGCWSLLIEDGLWSVEAQEEFCSRVDAEIDASVLKCLDGQKIMEVIVKDEDCSLTMKFDLGAQMTVRFSCDFDENEQWMLYTGDEGVLACGHRNGFVVEISGSCYRIIRGRELREAM